MNVINEPANVIEDSDCDESGEVVTSRRQQRPTTTAAIMSDDTDKLTREFLSTFEMELSNLSSTSLHCSIVSVKKASVVLLILTCCNTE